MTNSLQKELAVAYLNKPFDDLAALPVDKIWCNASMKFELKSWKSGETSLEIIKGWNVSKNAICIH